MPTSESARSERFSERNSRESRCVHAREPERPLWSDCMQRLRAWSRISRCVPSCSPISLSSPRCNVSSMPEDVRVAIGDLYFRRFISIGQFFPGTFVIQCRDVRPHVSTGCISAFILAFSCLMYAHDLIG